MHKRSLAVALVFGLAAGTGASGAEADQKTRVAQLINQLGSKKFREREAATKELRGIGEIALEALKKAAHAPGDPERQQRAEKLVVQIEGYDAATMAKLVEELLPGLMTLNRRAQRRTTEAIINLGPHALPALNKAAGMADADLRPRLDTVIYHLERLK
jgi:hypothetical protein